MASDRERSRDGERNAGGERAAPVQELFDRLISLVGHRSQRLESFSKSSKVGVSELFVKVHPGAITAADLLRGDNGLMPRDVAMLFAMVMEMDPGTGRINLSTGALAKKCGVAQSSATTSVTRLKKLGLVLNRRDRDSGGYFFLVNPEFASVGTAATKRLLDKNWEKEWFQSLEQDYSESQSAARDRMESLYFKSLKQLAPDQEEIEEAAEKATAEWLEKNPRKKMGRPRNPTEAELDERVFDFVSDKLAAT